MWNDYNTGDADVSVGGRGSLPRDIFLVMMTGWRRRRIGSKGDGFCWMDKSVALRSTEEYRSAFQIFDIGGSLQLLLVQEGRAEIEQKKCLSVKWVSIY